MLSVIRYVDFFRVEPFLTIKNTYSTKRNNFNSYFHTSWPGLVLSVVAIMSLAGYFTNLFHDVLEASRDVILSNKM